MGGVIIFAVLIGLAILAASYIHDTFKSRTNSTIKSLKIDLAERNGQLLVAKRALNEAERTLRNIANNAASPVLEAQIALDSISRNYHEKELS